MPGLIANLLAGTRAMNAQSKGAEIAGKNLANLNTVGYSRERISIEPQNYIHTPQGTESSGVEVNSLQQLRDRFLDGEVLRQTSDTGNAQATSDILSRAQTALGESLDRTADSSDVNQTGVETTAGVQSALNNFFNSFQSLAASPTEPAARQAVLQSANTLANRLNDADGRLAQVQSDVTKQISVDVDSVNGILKAVAKLNAQIASAENGAIGPAPELRDQRQAKLEELAKYINFQVQPDTAATGGAMQINVLDSTGASVPLVQSGRVLNTMAFDGTNFTAGAPPTNVALTSGSLEAMRSTSANDVQAVRDQLSKLATQITQSVNTAYNGSFFTTPPSGGLLAVDPAVTATTLQTTATGTSGGNELAVAVANVANQKFATSGGDAIDGTPAGFFSTVVSGLGGKTSEASVELENQKLLSTAAVGARDNVSGVSLDEETTDLLRYQRAFQASARFVTTMDELLNLVVNQMGAR